MLTDKVVAGYTDLPFVVNVINPVPILQQNKSSITTNPFIPNEQKDFELEMLNKEANEIMEKEFNTTQMASIKNQTLNDILKNISDSTIGLLDDLFKKPANVGFIPYFEKIVKKNHRYAYLGILLIIIAFLLYHFTGNLRR